MDARQVVNELSDARRLPVEAIRAAQADRGTMVPMFLRSIDGFLSLEGMMRAVGRVSDPGHDGYCNACFTGRYPIPVEEAQAKLASEQAVGVIELTLSCLLAFML